MAKSLLEDVSFIINEGEHVVNWANGTGKSTPLLQELILLNQEHHNV